MRRPGGRLARLTGRDAGLAVLAPASAVLFAVLVSSVIILIAGHQPLDAYRAQGGEDVTVEPHLQVFEGLKDLEQDGNTSHVGGYRYPSSDAAFDAACNALKEFL